MKGRMLLAMGVIALMPGAAWAQGQRAKGSIGIKSGAMSTTPTATTTVAGGTQIARRANGLSGSFNVLDFSELGLAARSQVGGQYAGLGVTFSSFLFQDPQSGWFNSPAIGNFLAGTVPWVVPTFSILFSDEVNRAAFTFITNRAFNRTTFTALHDGVVVSSFLASTDADTHVWYGFEGITFDEIRIGMNFENNSMLLDNLQIGTAAIATPEPASLVLLGTGLLCLGGAVARRKRSELPA